MEQQILDSTLSQLGNTIGQLSIDLSIARATNEELSKEIERLNKELQLKAEVVTDEQN